MEAIQAYSDPHTSHDAHATSSLATSLDRPERPVWQAISRGLRGHCPACDKGKIFYRYLKVNDKCPSCGEELFHQRADDAPPYMTIFIVAHIVVGAMLLVEGKWADLPIWIHLAIWPALTIILSLVILPMMKGALIAYQWALRMHGFDDTMEAEKAAAE